jgi:hypothetical protein
VEVGGEKNKVKKIEGGLLGQKRKNGGGESSKKK